MVEEDEWSYEADDFDEESAGPGDDRTADASAEGAAAATTDEGEDDGWRFSLADLADDEQTESGWLDLSAEVEAGSPALENVAFVLVGVALGVGLAVFLVL